jgi:hypothetical protein
MEVDTLNHSCTSPSAPHKTIDRHGKKKTIAQIEMYKTLSNGVPGKSDIWA